VLFLWHFVTHFVFGTPNCGLDIYVNRIILFCTCHLQQHFYVVVEPQYSSDTGAIELSARQIARDHLIFYKVLQSFPCFSKSIIVGPDVAGFSLHSEGLEIIQA